MPGFTFVENDFEAGRFVMRRKKTVLVVDDGSRIEQTAMALSEDPDYDVLLASTGSMALYEARQRGSEIDLLLTRIDLAGPGMSGLDLAAAMTRETPRLKVLLMGRSQAEKVAAGEKWPFLAQPFDEWQLRKAVRTLCHQDAPSVPRALAKA
jgi:DNA-binding NtrC family response regulator